MKVDPFSATQIGVAIDSGEFIVRARPHSGQEAIDCSRLAAEMTGVEYLSDVLVPFLSASVQAVEGLDVADYPANVDDRAEWWLSAVPPSVAFASELCIRIGRAPGEGGISESGTSGKSPASED